MTLLTADKDGIRVRVCNQGTCSAGGSAESTQVLGPSPLSTWLTLASSGPTILVRM